MFCHQCGVELRETDRFCFHCGAPVKDVSGSTEEAATQNTPDAEPPAVLIPGKENVSVTGEELHLNGKHYIRTTDHMKFKAEKRPSVIPLDSVLGISLEHYRYGGRIFLSFLLLLCFAAGFLFSARYSHGTYLEWKAPYRDRELAAQERILSIIDNDGAGRLLLYQENQKENRAEAEALRAKLGELETQRAQEILAAACSSDRFDPDDFFHRELFSRAYQDYLQDLLNAFKNDELLHSWLYSYYKTTKEYGGNDFLDTDLWIYNGVGENIFSPDLDSADSLMGDRYDLDLWEHMIYTGRIYITGADFLQKILSLPGYAVDGAVFAKACGGVPEASEMSVPGWSGSQYEEFWLYNVDYFGAGKPMWLDYGFQSGSFSLDWNALVNESAYHDAYLNFMDKIAPGLPRFETASYHADDTAYGGMGYALRGTEPSFDDIVTSYAGTHPEFIEELAESNIFSNAPSATMDGEITETEVLLEKLENEYLYLQEQEERLAQILANADIHRSNHAFLLADIERHTQKLTRRLLFFGGSALLCAFAALVCLCAFFAFFMRPRHLLIVSIRNRDYAIRTRRCPGEQIAALQNRLPQKQAEEICSPLP